jgi:hypothetical protein
MLISPEDVRASGDCNLVTSIFYLFCLISHSNEYTILVLKQFGG